MVFGFRVDGVRFDKRYGGRVFASKDPEVKLLLAVGQASTFNQSDEHYISYLQRMINKGVAEGNQIAPEGVNELLHELVEEGYCQNGSTRYRLTPKAVELLIKDGRQGQTATSAELVASEPLPQSETDNNGDGEASIIRPLALPRLNHKLSSGWLDEEQHSVNKSTAHSFGYRSLEILAELELADGTITVSNGRLANEIRLRAESDVGSDSYIKAIESLQRKGLASISEDGDHLSLTPSGYELIALLKTYPDELREEAGQRIWASTSLQIIELVMRETGVVLDVDMNAKDLPERTDWLLPRNNANSLFSRLAQALNMSEDAVTRRLYDMRKTKGYVETEILDRDEKEREIITNIRVLRKGLEYALTAQKELRAREQVLDETEVEEAQELIDGCYHLAESLGESKLVEQLKQRYDMKSLFELTEDEFTQERASLETLFEDLRRDYIFENSRPLAA